MSIYTIFGKKVFWWLFLFVLVTQVINRIGFGLTIFNIAEFAIALLISFSICCLVMYLLEDIDREVIVLAVLSVIAFLIWREMGLSPEQTTGMGVGILLFLIPMRAK